MGETPAILLIEDEVRLRNNLRILLEGEGYRVATAQTGAEGIRKAEEEPYDLVITDIVMPGMNGFQVMDHLKTHLPDTVVLAITGYVSTESAIQALRRGAYDYLSKPFDVDIMKVTVERALEKVRLQKALRRHMSELEQKVEERTHELTVANQKLEKSLVDLKAAQEHLIQAEKLSALGELIAGVAHELNSPLSTIALNVQLAASAGTGEDRAKAQLERIGDATSHCRQIVKSLLSFARKQRPEVASTQVNAVCDKVLDLLAYQLKVNSIELEKRFDERLPQTMADPHQLQQVFLNLATNACQAMSSAAGGGRLLVETKATDGVIQIGFHDDGPGISKEHQRKIFDPFFTTKADGTGLGLSISYGIIKEHGGEISVRSVPGKGTTFLVELPITTPREATNGTSGISAPQRGPALEHEVRDTGLLRAAARETAVHHAAARGEQAQDVALEEDGTAHAKSPGSSSSGTARVLIVDDDRALLGTLADVVEALGYEGHATSSADAALEIAERLLPDVALIDLNIPGGLPGRALLQKLLAVNPAVRVIVLTGSVDPELEREIRAFGASDFLRKPVDLQSLEHAISREAGRLSELA
jgi:signal transduction histidine kinase